MCDNNKNECKCEKLELCRKMLKAAIDKSIIGLEAHKDNANTIKRILFGIESIFKEYSECIPCEKLQNRAAWVNKHIEAGTYDLRNSEVIFLESYIKELKTFFEN